MMVGGGSERGERDPVSERGAGAREKKKPKKPTKKQEMKGPRAAKRQGFECVENVGRHDCDSGQSEE
jgi:hypothetical protein